MILPTAESFLLFKTHTKKNMIKKLLIFASISFISANAFAQSREREYKVTINDKDSATNAIIDAKLKAAFFQVYPKFAQADGYRTKRNVVLDLVTRRDTNNTSQSGRN
ncbi:hypothetical protein QFZ20_005204 [Flavobacterium sp. W4I14]|nr:hypothetical protein [Flavobacterium sp. W4I14]